MRLFIILLIAAGCWFAYKNFDFNKVKNETVQTVKTEKRFTRVNESRQQHNQAEQEVMSR